MSTSIVQIASQTGYDVQKVELVKNTIAKGASDDELLLFLGLCQRTGLDPFMKQIYLIERWADGKRTMVPQTGIDGFRLLADRTDRYTPGREPTFTYDESGNLIAATAYVKKWVRGDWHEVAATAHYSEYVQTKKDGTPNKFWKEKPHVMLAKCAEAIALRRAFPAELNGIYAPEEMDEQIAPALPQQRQQTRRALPINGDTGEIIDAPPVLVPPELDDATKERLATVKSLVVEIRRRGVTPVEITPAAVKNATEEDYQAMVAVLKDTLAATIEDDVPADLDAVA